MEYVIGLAIISVILVGALWASSNLTFEDPEPPIPDIQDLYRVKAKR